MPVSGQGRSVCDEATNVRDSSCNVRDKLCDVALEGAIAVDQGPLAPQALVSG
jgi:hypothetical protein